MLCLKKITKTLFTMLLITVIFCSCEESGDKYDDYSYGLDEYGYYENFDDYSFTLPDFESPVSSLDVIEAGVRALKESGDDTYETADDYIEECARLLISENEIDKLDVVTDSSVVTFELTLTLSGVVLDEYCGEKTVVLNKDSWELEKSTINRTIGETYSLEVALNNDYGDYSGYLADADIEITDIREPFTITDAYVRDHLEAIHECVSEDINSRSDFYKIARLCAADLLIDDYIYEMIRKCCSDIPDDFINAEIYRFNARIENLGFTFNQYVKASGLSKREIIESCKDCAEENAYLMFICRQNGIAIEDEDCEEVYNNVLGDSGGYETYIQFQGLPYMKLSAMKSTALSLIEAQITYSD